MKIEIKNIHKSDYRAAVQFAIKGMHFDWYLNNKFLLEAYGRYFWYLEMNRATQILAAYVDNVFVGVLLAEIYGEEKAHCVWTERLWAQKKRHGLSKNLWRCSLVDIQFSFP